MKRIGRKRLVVVAAAVLGAVGAGGAVAATTGGTPAEESTAVVNDAAAALGVTPAQLEDALEGALAGRVDAAVADGRLTEAQGAELKARIASGEVPLLGLRGAGFGGHGRHGEGRGPGASLEAAAAYLGVGEAGLHERLHAGETLAEVAAAEGKSVDGLVAALVADAKERLAQAQEEGRLDADRRAELEAVLEGRLRELVEREHPRPGPGRNGGGRPGGAGTTDGMSF